MNIVAQEARKRQAVVKYALRKGKSEASRKYGYKNDGTRDMTAAHGNHCCLSRIDRTAIQINTQNQKKENSRTHSRKSSSDTAGTAYIKICTDGTGRKSTG